MQGGVEEEEELQVWLVELVEYVQDEVLIQLDHLDQMVHMLEIVLLEMDEMLQRLLEPALGE